MSEEQTYLNLQPTEQAVVHAAGQIYAAYVIAGKAEEDPEGYQEKAVIEAVKIARMVDEKVVAPGEMQ